MPAPVFDQVNIVSDDVDASVEFYRRLGIDMPDPFKSAAGVSFHTGFRSADGITVDLDAPAFATAWNKGWTESQALIGRVVLGLRVETRDDVDRIFADMTAAGYVGMQPPYDAFWGARYAIVQDPSGLAVGLMSPAADAFRATPPM